MLWKIKFYFVAVLFLIPFFYLPSSVSADWGVDNIPPDCDNISPSDLTYQVGVNPNFSVRATDDFGIDPTSFSVLVGNVGNYTLPFPPMIRYTPKTPPYTSITRGYSWHSNPNIPTGTSLHVAVKDNNGNLCNYNTSFNITTGTPPWLKTSGGDVHSNNQ